MFSQTPRDWISLKSETSKLVGPTTYILCEGEKLSKNKVTLTLKYNYKEVFISRKQGAFSEYCNKKAIICKSTTYRTFLWFAT